jgi:predicted MFS family arabinose efflux permease
MKPRVHRAWLIAGVTFLTLICAAAFRSSMGALLEPLEAEFGWSRSMTSSAASINLVLYGLTAPFAAALMQRFQVRQVVAFALLTVAVGSGLTVFMTQSWQLLVLWGGFVGIGTGSIALVFGAIIANRWFVARRGLVTGVFSAASATGQLLFLPAVAHLATNYGWRSASLIVTVLALLTIPLVLALLADRPSSVGTLPYGAPEDFVEPPHLRLEIREVAGSSLKVLFDAFRSRPFWILAGTFFVCGWSTNGLIQTHFISAAHDHGMPMTVAAGLLAVIGIFDIVGTISSGWLTDRVDSRLLLLAYYGLRGLSLLFVPAVLGPHVEPPLIFFIVFYGLDWVATVPPTVQLCREHFGLEKSGIVYGWVFASHMIGAGAGATFAGWVRTINGDYSIAWYMAGGLCLVAAVSIFGIKKSEAGVVAP